MREKIIRVVAMLVGAIVFAAGYGLRAAEERDTVRPAEPADTTCAECIQIDEYPIRGRT